MGFSLYEGFNQYGYCCREVRRGEDILNYFLSLWVTTEAAGQRDTCMGEDSIVRGVPRRINFKMLLSCGNLTSVPRDQRSDISGRVSYQKWSKQNTRVHFSTLCISGLTLWLQTQSKLSWFGNCTDFLKTYPSISLLPVHKNKHYHACPFAPAHPQVGWPSLFLLVAMLLSSEARLVWRIQGQIVTAHHCKADGTGPIFAGGPRNGCLGLVVAVPGITVGHHTERLPSHSKPNTLPWVSESLLWNPGAPLNPVWRPQM